ncbi:COX15/CtaA family protein [Nocardioides acrostichi]|uniref:COX15/CtaA family protein n=1 Tax=Nocardioides acrostichi TaxID=2784339 RepID=UPI002E2966AB|nr:COX15/CtaA family protein [Nocardioides acrostichi]
MGVDTARAARWAGRASLAANIGIVVTGGAVRLTGSGLGCPTWPRCTDEGFTPHGSLSYHSAIEFGNRMLTFVLVAVAVVTVVAAWRTGRRDLRVLSVVLALGIPLQAVIGGITVLTDLNPWIVSLHLLLSLAMIGLSVRFLQVLDRPVPAERGPTVVLAWATFAAAWIVLYLGTVVTGSGPHAGDAQAPRNGLDPLQLSQLHADAVFLLVGLSVAMLVMRPARAAWALVGVEIGQGAVGFVQYFTGLPEVLVGLHVLGAALTSAAVTWLLLSVRHPPSAG